MPWRRWSWGCQAYALACVWCCACAGEPSPGPRPPPSAEPGASNAAAPAEAARPRLACEAGFADCDGLPGNGCEVETDGAAAHCGACDRACGSDERCVLGACRAGPVQLVLGSMHGCLLELPDAVRCWGLGALGQLARGSRAAARTPITIAGLERTVALAAGRDLTCALDAAGSVRCWGEGPMARPEHAGSRQPGAVEALPSTSALSVSIEHACAVASGRVHCWGSNVAGQLGDGTLEGEGAVVQVEGLADARGVAAGGAHSCAFTAGGEVHCWGDNSFGQLGDGSLESRPLPAKVRGLTNVVELAAGQFHTCARTRAGRVSCWGRDEAGQVGAGTAAAASEPGPGPGAGGDDAHEGLVAAAADAVAAAERADPIGDSPRANRTVRAPLELAIDGVAAVFAGQRHSCALLRSGRALCWGDNGEGQLGDGTLEDRARPTPFLLEQRIIAMATGGLQTCVVDVEGAVHCAGLPAAQPAGHPAPQAVLPQALPLTPSKPAPSAPAGR